MAQMNMEQMISGNSSPMLTTSGLAYPHLYHQVGFIVLPRQNEGPSLLSVVADGLQGELSHSQHHRASSHICLRC